MISVPKTFEPTEVHISDFQSGKKLINIIDDAIERDAIINFQSALTAHYEKLMIHKNKDESAIQLLNEFAVAGLVIGNYYMHDQIRDAPNIEKRNYKQTLLI